MCFYINPLFTLFQAQYGTLGGTLFYFLVYKTF